MFLAPRLTPTTPRRRNRLPWYCCAALVLGLGAWTRAEATCGDYLAIGSGHYAMPSARGTEQVPNPTPVGIPLPGVPVHLPCDGPGCSPHETPVTTMEVVVRIQHELTGACLAKDHGILKSPPRWASQPQESLAALDFVFRILRPPRPLSLHRSARDEVA